MIKNKSKKTYNIYQINNQLTQPTPQCYIYTRRHVHHNNTYNEQNKKKINKKTNIYIIYNIMIASYSIVSILSYSILSYSKAITSYRIVFCPFIYYTVYHIISCILFPIHFFFAILSYIISYCIVSSYIVMWIHIHICYPLSYPMYPFHIHQIITSNLIIIHNQSN